MGREREKQCSGGMRVVGEKGKVITIAVAQVGAGVAAAAYSLLPHTQL